MYENIINPPIEFQPIVNLKQKTVEVIKTFMENYNVTDVEKLYSNRHRLLWYPIPDTHNDGVDIRGLRIRGNKLYFYGPFRCYGSLRPNDIREVDPMNLPLEVLIETIERLSENLNEFREYAGLPPVKAYSVDLTFRGSMNVEVLATNEDDALAKARHYAAAISPKEFLDETCVTEDEYDVKELGKENE